jgi:hypothetical protein
MVFEVERRVDHVARRARHVADDHALFAEDRVHQRRLADVRAADDREPLPAWDDFGRYFVRGAAVALAGLIYTLPAIVIFVLALLAARSAAPAIIVLVLLLLVYFLVVAIVFPLGLTRYALTDSWSGMFDFGWMARAIGAKPGPYVLVLVVSFVVFGVAAAVGTMLLGIGSLFTVWVAWLFMSHLLGQFARELGGV